MKRNVSWLGLMAAFVLLAQNLCAQNWTLAGPDDANQPAFYPPYSSAMAADPKGGFYVGYNDYVWLTPTTTSTQLSVRHWNDSVWTQVGAPAFSAGSFDYLQMAVSKAGVPYVVYKDFGNSRRAMVMTFNGSAWVSVGALVSPGTANFTCIALDASGAPIVAYQDSAASKKATVKKWNGTNWQTLGAANFSPANVFGLKLAAGSNGQPRLLVQYYSGSGATLELFSFDGSNWNSLGSPAGAGVDADWADLVLGRSDTPFVAYTNASSNNRAFVAKYNGSAWNSVGSGAISPSAAAYLQLMFDSTAGLYLGCMSNPAASSFSPDYPMLRHFNGSNWAVAGPDSFAVRRTIYTAPTFGIDTAHVPHLLYDEPAYQSKLVLSKLTASGWVYQGSSEGIAKSPVWNIKMAASPDGKAAYCFMSNLYGNSGGSRVFRYDTSWTQVGQSGLSGWSGYPVDIAVDPGGVPWMAVQDSAYFNHRTVWRLTAGGWANAGLSDTGSAASLSIDGNGTVYLASQQIGGGIRVYKYAPGGWTRLTGSPISSSGIVDFVRMRTDRNGVPFVLAGIHISTTPYYQYAFQVYRYTGSGWAFAGPQIVSSNNTPNDGPPGLAFDTSNIPYVSYLDGNLTRTLVKKLDSANYTWVDVVPQTAAPQHCMAPGIQFAADGSLYLCYSDRSLKPIGSLSVLKLSGASWQTVGTSSFSKAVSYQPQLALLNNRLLTAFTDGAAYAYKNVCASPALITGHSLSQFVCANGSAQFGIAATGATAYRWQYMSGGDWMNVPDTGIYSGAKTDTLSLSSVGINLQGTRYRCVLTNACGGTMIGETLLLLVDTPTTARPAITISADKTQVCQGSPVRFSASTTNAGVLHWFDWRINGVSQTGMNDSVFITTALAPGDTVNCLLVRLSACTGTADSAISNTLSDTIITTQSPTAGITAIPGTSITAGQSVTFTSTVTNGGPNMQYQWLLNGSDISGATASSYTTSTLADNDAVSLRVTRTDTCAAVRTTLSPALIMHVSTGVSSLRSSYGVAVYPQPARDVLNLSGAAGLPAGMYRLRLSGSTGQLMLERSLRLDGQAWKYQLSLPANLPAGMYQLRLQGPVEAAFGLILIAR